MRVILAILFLVLLLWPGSLLAQSPYASVVGIVFDPDSKTIPGAEIIVVNDVTRVQYQTKTNNDGIYAVANLPPGPYRVQVSKIGFKTIIKPDIILNVQDALSINFTLPVGAASVTVTVEGGAPMINTTDGSVSTVIDHTYVENMPLNGRSFQDLILLTPGVVTTSPQTQAALGQSGEFSVNGQRTEANYYTVDGVSANLGITPGTAVTPSAGGSLPAATALGTTQGLVSVDALAEFRVQSSSYSAEYGRNPGGQFAFATRSGTNDWHGAAFDYFRNNVLDANDWFNGYYDLPQPALRQNDFGGTLGGALIKDRSFFFFSYEGLRAVQPQEASVSYVPTELLKQSAPAALQPLLSAFPVANGQDLGNGLGEFIGTWSNPSRIDATSIRLDHTVNKNLRLFFRFADAESEVDARSGGNYSNPSNPSLTSFVTRTYTLGAIVFLSDRYGNDFGLNYSSNSSISSQELDSFGGAQPVDLRQLQGTEANESSSVGVALNLPGYDAGVVQSKDTGLQRQWSLVDTANFSSGRHQFKFGVDFRRLSPKIQEDTPSLYYAYESSQSIQTNMVDIGEGFAYAPANPIYKNFSAFVQDEWRPTNRLNVSVGLRWEINPAPGGAKGDLPYTVAGSSLSTLTLAPQGTPLWKTTWYNLAPRLGAAYLLRSVPGWEMVVRSGAGVFYDTGQQVGSYGYAGPGFESSNYFGSSFGGAASFPVPLNQAVDEIVNPPVAPYGYAYAFPSHLQLPYTLQWNGSIEQSLGVSQAITVSYVGAAARRLLEQSLITNLNGNPNFYNVTLFQNGLTSDYNALQVRFQRRLSKGLTALSSYTWSHCIDYGSQNLAYPSTRGNCDYDVRHNLSGAFSYDLAVGFRNRFKRAILRDWGVDGRLSARGGFPVTLDGPSIIAPGTGQFEHSGLDQVPGQPVYLTGGQYPGGRAINPAAFVLPAGCMAFSCDATATPGNAPRNFLRGFGAWQTDAAIRRQFPISERLKLEFRVESFNIFNHPNFGFIQTQYGNNLFGQATATLAQSLGVLSPLYQAGGPRSIQLSLKLRF